MFENHTTELPETQGRAHAQTKSDGTISTVPKARAKTKSKKPGFWKKQARTWHWVSGAICLVGMLLFSVTGITLNHAAQIPAHPVISEKSITLSDTALSALRGMPTSGTTENLPPVVADSLRTNLDIHTDGKDAEWTDIDVYIALPRPGGDAWVSIDRTTGEVLYEQTSRGSIAYLNDLHKGRNTGPVWSWFLDIFSVASIIFCLSGLWLLQIHASKRATTWPLTIGGLAIPGILALLFIH